MSSMATTKAAVAEATPGRPGGPGIPTSEAFAYILHLLAQARGRTMSDPPSRGIGAGRLWHIRPEAKIALPSDATSPWPGHLGDGGQPNCPGDPRPIEVPRRGSGGGGEGHRTGADRRRGRCGRLRASLATDRMATLRPGSPGLALLNLASWHASVGETMMALAVHSEISSASEHPNDLVALSRLEVGRLHQKIGDEPSSLRHLWSSASRFSEEGMKGEEAIALLEWLDLALDCLAEDAERMDVVANTMPRTNMEPSEAKAHPEDVLDSGPGR